MVGDLQADRRLAAVDVLVGGVLQRPYLQRRIADTTTGLVNVRFSTLGEFGVRLGELALMRDGRRPLPAMAERAYAAEVARHSAGYFEPVATTPGFAEVARRLVRELRQEGVEPEQLRDASPGAVESSAKAQALVDLYQRYLDGRAGCYDGEDALAAAEPERFDGTALLLFGIWRLSTVARRLLERLAERVPVIVFLPGTDSADADAAHADLRDLGRAVGGTVERLPEDAPATALGAVQSRLLSVPTAPIVLDQSVDLLTAPDALTEVREAARVCLAWARDGVAFREMAVTYRQAEIYRPLIEAVFAEAGLPVYLDDGPSLAERPLGRRILALLDLIGSDLPRRQLMSFLSDGWLPKETRERFGGAPAARWDSASRRAGIVAGLDQWRSRLRLMHEREAAEAAQPDAPEWLARRADDGASLLAFVEDLGARLARLPERASWRESLAALRELLVVYVRDCEDVLGYLDSLAQLDSLVPEVEFERFLDLVRAEVRALKAGDLDEGQQGAFGRRGVNVLDTNAIRGLRFRAVCVLGLTERTFPPPPRQDPLLLDEERTR